MTKPTPSRWTERKSIIISAVIAVIILLLFLFVDGSQDPVPVTSEGGESPTTEAPSGVEPPEPMTDQPTDR
ncbi:MAG: hypothetical protein K5872_14675 [Rhizobiaceae bacterium]|nr:hypothetical protein [Rhizobiaceae bacterium]MCV0407465.1 hypothetical protein [Rhizobiaceae bacterium]